MYHLFSLIQKRKQINHPPSSLFAIFAIFRLSDFVHKFAIHLVTHVICRYVVLCVFDAGKTGQNLFTSDRHRLNFIMRRTQVLRHTWERHAHSQPTFFFFLESMTGFLLKLYTVHQIENVLKRFSMCEILSKFLYNTFIHTWHCTLPMR